MTKSNFSQKFWTAVKRAMREQQVTVQEVASYAGIKRSTFLGARLKNQPLSFVNSILVLRALNIPTFVFTVQMIKHVEKYIEEENLKCESRQSTRAQRKAR